jgi:glycosyltransferase involved in cell wall biosynthesis
MHVLNVLQCTNLGGTEQGAFRLMQALRPYGHSSEVVSMHPAGRFVPKLEAENIPVTSLDYRGRFGWRSHLSVRRTFRKLQADCLIMHGPTLSGVLAVAPACPGHRILSVHYHHQGVKPDWSWRRMYAMVHSRFQFVTFCSDYIRREAEALYPALVGKTRTIMYPLTVPDLPEAGEKQAARQRLGLPLEARLIGNAGWLIPRKRFDVFLQVASRVATRCPNAEFVIAGDGVERANLERLAGELGVASRIHWLGWQTDLTDFYHSIDVLEFNSDWDAMGLTCLEAASHAVPVVASVLNGGLSEVLGSENVLGRHDFDALADRCVRLLESPQAAAEQGRAMRSLVATRCSPSAVAGQYDELLRSTYNGNGHA